MSNEPIQVGSTTFNKPGNDWAAYVMQCIRDKPLAEAGKELAVLVLYTVETEQYGPFVVDMHACVTAFWDRCHSITQESKVLP